MAKRVRLNVNGLNRFGREVRRSFGGGPIDAMYKKWGARYLAFVRRRFVKFSRGGGDWAPLDPQTVKRRRKGKGRGGAATLRDTGTLLTALTVGSPGNLFKRTSRGIRVGFGGPSRHPDGKATIADIARFHDAGSGDLPQRSIIVAPDAPTITRMNADAAAAGRALGRKVQV